MKSGFESYNATLVKNSGCISHPIFIGTPHLGVCRMEWALARFGQIIPCNWGYKGAFYKIPDCSPMNYLIPDAQNYICGGFLKTEAEWLLFIESDNLIPPDCFLRLNEYVRKKEVPIVSGLYFTKSIPSEPLVYRGRGNGYYTDWKIGDLVWVDGVPTGALLIHRSIIQALWNESEEYTVGTDIVRRVFAYPRTIWHDPEVGLETTSGTTDLEWCSRIIVENIFYKAGWKEFQEKRFPFLIDTNIFVGHIDMDGAVYPPQYEKAKWEK